MANNGRSINGERAVPHFPLSPDKGTAKYVRLVMTRYLAGRASLSEVKRVLVESLPVFEAWEKECDARLTGNRSEG